MKEVLRLEFYTFLNSLDVIGTLSDRYPYTTSYSLRHGRSEIARIVDSYGAHKGIVVSNYFIRK